MNRMMAAIIKRAGVQAWERLWQTSRSSCEKEWAMAFPQFAVSRWIGHSITVSGKHYANSVHDELFERAAGIRAAKNPVQQVPETARTVSLSGSAGGEAVVKTVDGGRQCGTLRKGAAAGKIGATGDGHFLTRSPDRRYSCG